jgi:hypothetical protein
VGGEGIVAIATFPRGPHADNPQPDKLFAVKVRDCVLSDLELETSPTVASLRLSLDIPDHYELVPSKHEHLGTAT